MRLAQLDVNCLRFLPRFFSLLGELAYNKVAAKVMIGWICCFLSLKKALARHFCITSKYVIDWRSARPGSALTVSYGHRQTTFEVTLDPFNRAAIVVGVDLRQHAAPRFVKRPDHHDVVGNLPVSAAEAREMTEARYRLDRQKGGKVEASLCDPRGSSRDHLSSSTLARNSKADCIYVDHLGASLTSQFGLFGNTGPIMVPPQRYCSVAFFRPDVMSLAAERR